MINKKIDLEQSSNDKLLSAFAGTQQNQTVEILKELLDDSKIDIITDLTEEQIKLCTRIYMIAEIKELDIWKTGLKYYMKLLLSKKRQSRKEILEAIKGSVTEQQGFFKNAMNSMRR